MIRGKQSPDMIIFLPPISLTFILSTHLNELLLGSVTKASSTQEQGGGLNDHVFPSCSVLRKKEETKALEDDPQEEKPRLGRAKRQTTFDYAHSNSYYQRCTNCLFNSLVH